MLPPGSAKRGAQAATISLRLAVLMELQPRKLGSMEAWVAALAREARRRGHQIDVFGRDPIHPQIAEQFAACGAG